MARVFAERYAAHLLDEHIKSHTAKAERYSAWEKDRNVIDEYKNLSNEEIKTRVEVNRLPYAILMTHLNIDYNLGAVLRLGNCLGAKVFYYGVKKWDKRPATGVWHYTPINHLAAVDEVRKLKNEYVFVGLEQTH